jgi:hypothetical protein
MNYFQTLPKLLVKDKQSIQIVTNLLARVNIISSLIEDPLIYYSYDIQDSDTPETLADRIYGDMMLYWVILVANNLFDPRWDWPLDEDTLRRYIVDKYGAGNEGAVHHYINADGDIVHSSYALAKTAVSNTTYELELNEAKRKISIIKPEFVPQFVKNFNGILLNNG